MAKSKSLVESNPGAGMPTTAVAPYTPATYDSLYQATPYVQFISSKGAAFGRMLTSIPDLNDGDPVLIRGETPPVRLSPFRFYLVQDAQHFSHVEETGEISESTFDAEKAKAEKPYFSEHIETVVLVCLPTGLIPARCTFKTLKCRAAMAAVKGIADASADTWSKLSAEHAATLCSPDPRFRFTTTVQVTCQTFRSTGRKGVLATGVVKPTSVADWKQVADAFTDETFRKTLAATMDRFNERMAEIRGLCAE